MKKNIKKLMSMLLVLTMVVALFAGCQGGTKDPTTVPKDTQPQGNASQPTEPEDTLSGTITIGVVARTGSQEGYEAVAAAYKEKHPNVNIVIDLKAQDGYADWIASLNNVDNPDVDIAEFTAAGFDHNRLLVLSDYLDIDSPYSDGTWGDQFENAGLTASAVTGELVELSLFSTQIMWIYNQAIFDEVGVEPPTTWDEFVVVCEKIAAAGYQPIAQNYQYLTEWLAQIYMDQTTRSTLSYIAAQPGDFCYDPDVDGKWTLDITDPYNDTTDKVNQNIVRALKAVKEGVLSLDTVGARTVWNNFAKVFPHYAGGDAFFTVGGDGISDLFYQSKAAMTFQGGWALIDFQRTLDELQANGSYVDPNGNTVSADVFTLGTFSMPSMTGDGIEAPVRTIEVPTSDFCILKKDQEHNDLVMDFIMFYTSEEGMSLYVDAMLAAGGTMDGPCLVNGVNYPDKYAPMFENLKSIGNVQVGYAYCFASSVPYITESAREFDNMAYEYLNGRMSVDDFMSGANANILKYLPYLQQALNISDADIQNPANAPVGY